MARTLAVGGALVVAIVAIYGKATGFDFVLRDDPIYVTSNPKVLGGLTLDGFRWAMTSVVYWQPLTMLSHMIDVEFFGTRAGAHHATSIGLHMLNSLLLLGVLCRMTRAFWPSALVAAAFAVHPLHVESVAWISERKDVLSTLFWLLATWAYISYARHGGPWRYAAVFAAMACGLMSKSTLVTLPFALLLLDLWPLRRLRVHPLEEAARPRAVRLEYFPPQPLGRLILEKLPLVGLSLAASIVTMGTQEHAISERLPFVERVANALMAYVWYVAKTAWPSGLSCFYPHPYLTGGTPPAAWQIAGCAALLVALTGLALRNVRTRPYLTVGWLWFVGTLVPMIGLVQVGGHAFADRYTYIPHIGLFVAVVWGAWNEVVRLAPCWAALPKLAATSAVLLLGAFGLAASRQVGVWRDSSTLWEHANTVMPSAPARTGLGREARTRGETDLAIRYYESALDLDPFFAPALLNLGIIFGETGRLEDAERSFRTILSRDPGHAKAHNNLGNVLRAKGELDEAILHFRRALEVDPSYGTAMRNLAAALRAGRSLER